MTRLVKIGAFGIVALAAGVASAMPLGLRTAMWGRAAVREDKASTCYTLNFHRYDASDGKTEAYDFDYGVSTVLPKLSELGWARRGFDFKGWATSQANAAKGKVWKTDGAWIKDGTAEGKTLSIYAIWE